MRANLARNVSSSTASSKASTMSLTLSCAEVMTGLATKTLGSTITNQAVSGLTYLAFWAKVVSRFLELGQSSYILVIRLRHKPPFCIQAPRRNGRRDRQGFQPSVLSEFKRPNVEKYHFL